MNEIAEKIKARDGHVRPSLKVKVLFYVMRFAQKKGGINLADHDYWKEKGWIGKKNLGKPENWRKLE